MEKDLQVAQLQVNEFKIFALKVFNLSGTREELAAAQSALELAHKNHKE